MVQSQSNIPAADYILNKDPWLSRLGSRKAGKLISESLFESTPAILRGRPIYQRLPGSAEAYNKDSNNFLSRGTIVLPEANTVISDAEDVYFRHKFPGLFEERDYISGSFLGAGSGAALYNDNLRPIEVSADITDREIFFRSAVLFWPRSAIRDSSDIAKQSIRFEGAVVKLPFNGRGWFWLDGSGNLNVTESLPDGIANLTGNVWCDPDALDGQKACVQRVFEFKRDNNYTDFLDVGLTDDEITWPPTPESEARYSSEAAPLYRFTTTDGLLTQWEDFRSFNRSFDPPVAQWLTDYWDNLLQSKREQIDTFVDDFLNPDTLGLNFISTESILRETYRPQTLNKIIDAWDFGLVIDEELENGIFSFLSGDEYQELINYDENVNLWLDWLAQHFGFQDNGSLNNNYWHNGSFYTQALQTNEVYYTIAEKRAILRNALSQDQYQNYTEVVAPIVIEPIWNQFQDFYNTTVSFWNRSIQVQAGEFEFRFTRFPFTVYDRIKPAEWFGLQRAKGTIKGLEFMFDVLGLHGYACNSSSPRLYDQSVDYATPLIVFKFVNSVTVERRRILDDNGNIVDATEAPLYNSQGYEQTGIFTVGETVFQSGYDRKVLVRAPFWDRSSQKWNRLVEISNTYARPGELVLGHYQFLAGLSAVNEPLWLPETCTSCKYNVSTKFFDTIVQNNDFDLEKDSLQNNIEDNSWEEISLDRNQYGLDDTAHIDEFYYVSERIILANISEAQNPIDTNGVNHDILPIIISTDNGKTYDFIQTDLSIDIDFVERIQVYGDYIYAIAKSDNLYYLLESLDNGTNWRLVTTNNLSLFNNEVFLDVVHDLDGRKIYLLTNEALYTKFDNNNTWTKLFEHDKKALSSQNLGSDGSNNPNFSIGRVTKYSADIYIYLYDSTKNLLFVQKTFNEGINHFVDFIHVTENIILDGATPEAIFDLFINNSAEEEEYFIAFLYDPGNIQNQSKLFASSINNTYTEIDTSIIIDAIEKETNKIFDLEFTSEDFNTSMSITDMSFDYSEQRWHLLITYTTDIEQTTGAIISLDKNFINPKIEELNIKLESQFNNLYGTRTNKFIKKIQTVLDIDAQPVNEPIEVLVDDDFVTICVPYFDENSNYPLPGTIDVPYFIYPENYLKNYRRFNWKLPRLRKSFDFEVVDNFTSQDLSITTDTKGDEITFSGTAYTETDQFSLFFKTDTVPGFFFQAIDNQQQFSYTVNFLWNQLVSPQTNTFDTVNIIRTTDNLGFLDDLKPYSISTNNSFFQFQAEPFFGNYFVNLEVELLSQGAIVDKIIVIIYMPEVSISA